MSMDAFARRTALAGSLASGLLPAVVRGATTGPRATVRRFYRLEDGANLQPAFQRAIDWAGANMADVVSDFGRIKGEMWCPERSRPDAQYGDGTPLVVRHAMAIDFAGATFLLKGPGGTLRKRGQPGKWKGAPWVGGWLHADGSRGIARLDVANVTVDGLFDGDVINNAPNLTDKGFSVFDEGLRELHMRNVELRNFGAEIFYVGGIGPRYIQVEDCHFHGSPQCAWNPGGRGRLLAINLRAGRAYQACEVLGGAGSVYRGGQFYDAGNGGCSIFGGPSAGLPENYPFWYGWWDGKGQPPYVRFFDTEFVRSRALWLGSWMRGRIRLFDTSLYLAPGDGRLTDIDLDVDAVLDQAGNNQAVNLTGVDQPGVPFPGASGARYGLPGHIRLRIACSRTAAAKAGGRTFETAVRYYGGLLDLPTVDISVRGEARNLFQNMDKSGHANREPRVRDVGYVRTP